MKHVIVTSTHLKFLFCMIGGHLKNSCALQQDLRGDLDSNIESSQWRDGFTMKLKKLTLQGPTIVQSYKCHN